MKRVSLVIAAVLTLGLSLGCEPITLKGDQVAQRVLDNGADWPFKPALMRVHPFTSLRYDEAAETHVISAHVEFRDRVNDVTKAVGTFRFELYRVPEGGAASAAGRKLETQWSASVQTIDENVAHYDRATRTYEFKLELERLPAPGSHLLLVVQFTDSEGRRYWAEGELIVPKSSETAIN